jgi:hypothetical protein
VRSGIDKEFPQTLSHVLSDTCIISPECCCSCYYDGSDGTMNQRLRITCFRWIFRNPAVHSSITSSKAETSSLFMISDRLIDVSEKCAVAVTIVSYNNTVKHQNLCVDG